nr:valine--tRNA ligase-like [Leptinotarsa decemlineata]
MYTLCRKCSFCGSDIKTARTLFRINYSIDKATELDQGYVPHKVETLGLGYNYFKPPPKHENKFSLVLPPPNITGTLHLGHALTATVQDVLVRWKQMQGFETSWVPGIDHAGIATQVVVEKRLWKESRQSRHDIGREAFHKKVWEWKEEKAEVIGEQLRRLNVSLDWEREVFTMDEKRSAAVQEAFIKLFEAGLIYRADQLVNWSCVLQSAISDIEVEHLSINGPTDILVPGYETPVKFGILTRFAYKVHERGAVKITPGHDHADFDAGKRHSLPVLQVIDESGRLTVSCGQFQGLRRFEARKIVLAELGRLGLLRGSHDHQMILPICSRSKDVIELLARPQWFINCSDMAARALDDVEKGRLTIVPSRFEKTWHGWLENIRDWCISRQLWWGHQIPAYSCQVRNEPEKKVWVAAKNQQEACRKASRKLDAGEDDVVATQDEDVLDTWFSSALQPFSSFGWPEATEDLSKHYPLSMMETGHDILFFWVARMVMLGTQLTGRLPFDKVLLHGIVCDAHGRKMSKSVGNVVAPEDVIRGITLEGMEKISKASFTAGVLSDDELNRAIQGQRKMFPEGIPECGSDALRFTLLSHNIKNHFINFDVTECYTNKLFCNKIWQATKFTRLWFTNVSNEQKLSEVQVKHLGLMDKWILSRLTFMVDTVNRGLENFDFYVATTALKNFLYYEFCDVYLETTKRGLRNAKEPGAVSHCWTLCTSLDTSLRALAPFMPVLSHHLHHHLPEFPGRGKRFDFPQDLDFREEEIERDVEESQRVVVAIRRLKKIFNVTFKHKPSVTILTSSSSMHNYSDAIQDLAGCHSLTVTNESITAPYTTSVKDVVGVSTIHLQVPEDVLKHLQADLPKMNMKKEKLLKELEKLNEIVSAASYKINVGVERQEGNSKKISTIQEKLTRIEYILDLIQR